MKADMTNLPSQFTGIALKKPEKPAVFWGKTTYSFGQAHVLAKRLAKRLREEHGLQPGDRVGLWLKNCPEFIFALFGIMLAEGVVVSINSFLTSASMMPNRAKMNSGQFFSHSPTRSPGWRPCSSRSRLATRLAKTCAWPKE